MATNLTNLLKMQLNSNWWVNKLKENKKKGCIFKLGKAKYGKKETLIRKKKINSNIKLMRKIKKKVCSIAN